MATSTADAVWEGGLKDGKGTMKTGSGAINGAYSFKAIAPGTYRAVTLRADDAVPVLSGRLAEDYREVSEVIEFTPKDKLTRDLKLRVPGSR